MTYQIEVVQHKTMIIEVEADSYDEARDKAVDVADINPDWDNVEAYYQTPDENGVYED